VVQSEERSIFVCWWYVCKIAQSGTGRSFTPGCVWSVVGITGCCGSNPAAGALLYFYFLKENREKLRMVDGIINHHYILLLLLHASLT